MTAPTPGELADAYTAGMKAEQGKGATFFPHVPGSLLIQEWDRGWNDSKADRANRERATDARLDADTDWNEGTDQ